MAAFYYFDIIVLLVRTFTPKPFKSRNSYPFITNNFNIIIRLVLPHNPKNFPAFKNE